ncbi:MAG: hypothetical protein DRI90_20485 [Deltaproteobacteria bacterium]|nr:MAG: hypothetical protein DRI90_20485 [Deltaproteobacteria bacterium]
MADPVLELEVLKRFVKPSKRARCAGFASAERTRDRLLIELRNPGIFDERYVHEVAPSERSPERLVQMFKESGMGGRVYVISSNATWDGKKFQMSWFVEEFLARGFDTLAYCWKSKTAFYEQHHSGFTYFLAR